MDSMLPGYMVFLAGLQELACVPPFLVSSPSGSLPLRFVTHTPMPLFTWPAAWLSGPMVLGALLVLRGLTWSSP